MLKHSSSKSNVTKIILYILFIVVIFTVSLLYMPYEFFFFAGVVVLFALREVEKEVMQLRKPY